MKKRLMMILSVMLVALTCVFAAQEMTVTWEWRTDDDPEVNYYRWQLNGTDPELWRIESGDTGEITVKELDPYQSYTLYLQRSYDGINWSETASAEASALLVAEVPEEAPVEEVAPVEEAAPAAEPAPVAEVVEPAPAAEPVKEAPAKKAAPVIQPVKKPSRFEFSLLMRPGAEITMNYGAKDYGQPRITPFALGLDFANIVSNDHVGFGLRWNIDADMYPISNGWSDFIAVNFPSVNPLAWEWKNLFNFAETYAWELDTNFLAMFNARAGIADFNIGLGAGASLLFDDAAHKNGAEASRFARYATAPAEFQNLFGTELDVAVYADLQLGMRFYLGKVVSLGLESNYKMYIPNYKVGDVGINAVLGFTF